MLEVKNCVNFGPQTNSYRRACRPTQVECFRWTAVVPGTASEGLNGLSEALTVGLAV